MNGNDAMGKHLIVISVDAMLYEDLALLKTLPNVGKLFETASVVQGITTIYPSLTHPVHATLMSGNPAGITGICNNEVFMPGVVDCAWNNRLDQMRCETIFHAAHRAGMTTCACRWPMTAGGFDVIDYLIPEVMDAEAEAEPDPEKLYRRVSTPALFDEIIKPRLSILKAPEKYPAYEIFSMRCAAEILRRYKPNLLLTHPGMVDHCRHLSGLRSPMVEEALRMTDEWIGWLMDAARDAGIWDRTSFCIVSDHGHLEHARTVALNAAFAELGLLCVDEDGTMRDWDVYCHSAGLSAQIYVKERARTKEIAALLDKMRVSGLYGFDQVFTREEVRDRYGLDGGFSFVVESDGYTAFSSDWNAPIVRVDEGFCEGGHHSSHGHRPERGPQPPMIVAGPAFRQNVILAHESVINEAPTFAAALGLDLPNAQGKPIQALLKE